MATSSFALSLAFISEGFPLWALYVAEEQLLFSKGALDIEVTHTGSSVKQIKDLESGLYDLGLQLPDHVIRSVEKVVTFVSLQPRRTPLMWRLLQTPKF